MNPYAFEELLLTCCHKRGWKIEPGFKYTGDGGLDGRVLIAGRLYLIGAKRYRGYINPKHIHDLGTGQKLNYLEKLRAKVLQIEENST